MYHPCLVLHCNYKWEKFIWSWLLMGVLLTQGQCVWTLNCTLQDFRDTPPYFAPKIPHLAMGLVGPVEQSRVSWKSLCHCCWHLWRKKESGHHRQCGFYNLLSSVKVNSSKICQISLILRHLLNKIYCAKFHCNCAKFHLNCAIFHWRFSRILPNCNCANFHWYCAIFN